MISLNEEQMKLLEERYRLEYSYLDEDEIKDGIKNFLNVVEPLLLPNLDEYLHNKTLSRIIVENKYANIPNTSITLHNILTKWTGRNVDQEAYKFQHTFEAIEMLSQYYRNEIFFYTLWICY